MTTQRDDRCVHLSPGLNTIHASCPVSHIAHIQSHTPPLRLPSSSWFAGVISSSQLLVCWTTDWTSSCRELQECWLLYHLQLRASGDSSSQRTKNLTDLLSWKIQGLLGCKHLIFLLFLSTKTDQKMSETHATMCTEHKAYWFAYSNNVLFSSKASNRNPESRVIVKERLLWQDVWIIETWKKEQKVHLDGLYNSYITRLNCLRISYCLL